MKHEGCKGKGTHQTTNDRMDKKLTLNELQAALRQLKAKKSTDAITNKILTHLGNKATCKLLEIFSWATGTLPQTWREASMIPILKKGKDPKQAASYRPSDHILGTGNRRCVT